MISVLMPVFNQEKYLRASIESILNQTYDNFEFLIINDGSTEKSLKIAKSYKDKRIKIFSFKKNRGIPISLNFGIKKAKRKYIARMDADDISLPTRLEKQLEFMESHGEIAVCGTAYKGFDNGYNRTIIRPTDPREIKCELLFGLPIAHPTVIARTEILKKYLYDPLFVQAEDFELWSRISQNHLIANLSEVLLLHRVHPAKKSTVNAKEMDNYTKIILERQRKNFSIFNYNLLFLVKVLLKRVL